MLPAATKVDAKRIFSLFVFGLKIKRGNAELGIVLALLFLGTVYTIDCL